MIQCSGRGMGVFRKGKTTAVAGAGIAGAGIAGAGGRGVARWGGGVFGLLLGLTVVVRSGLGLEAVVEVEEDLYTYEPANNGAGPMWCGGSTCIARVGEVVYATGLETIAGAKPLNNCRWVLWRRDATSWKRWVIDEDGRTREPAPVATTAAGLVLVSANPTLNPPEKEGGGPAEPAIFEFATLAAGLTPGEAPVRGRRELPWDGKPKFSEHSYRSFAADRGPGSTILFQNIDYTHAEWSFRDGKSGATAAGRLKWPWGADYAKPQPIRVCYPNVALRGRAVYFCGVSDLQDPNPAWRAYKKELTGREWDYDFRRLFYTWTSDVTSEPFHDWLELASREATCGWISPSDLWVAPDGSVLILWSERALDERLREKFFPLARQSHSLRLAVVKQGRVVSRRTLLESREDAPGPVAGAARFQELADGRLAMLRYVSGPAGAGNELVPVSVDGTTGDAVKVAFAKPFTSYFTATPRAGSAAADVIDVLGVRSGTVNTLGYARVRVR